MILSSSLLVFSVMLIEISTLPIAIQEQILAVKQGQTVQFANHGKVIGKLTADNTIDSLTATYGMWQGVDGVAYERKIRSEWD